LDLGNGENAVGGRKTVAAEGHSKGGEGGKVLQLPQRERKTPGDSTT